MLFLFFETFLTLHSIDTECVLVFENQFGFKDTASSLSNNKPSVCFSPAEPGVHYCIEKAKYWANLGGCTAALVGISETVLGICRRLDYTQVLVNRQRFSSMAVPFCHLL